MEELQQQITTWCLALKDYLKCEQCQQKLSPDIYLCQAGHLVCASCLQKSSDNLCTFCKLPFTRTRNYLAENLAEKLDNVLEKLTIGDDKDDLQSVCSEFGPAWNIFPCWMGRCKFQGSPEEIRQHYRNNHGNFYEMLIENQLPVSRNWNFDYTFPCTRNQLFDITDLGLFLLHIIIYDNGAMRAYVFFYGSGRTARSYNYQVVIECSGENLSSKGMVDSARIPRNLLSKRGVFIPRGQNLQVQLQKIKKFTVSVEISKNPKNHWENCSENLNKQNKCKNRKSKPSKPLSDNQEPKIPDKSNENDDKTANKSGENKNPPSAKKKPSKNLNSDGRKTNEKSSVVRNTSDFQENQPKVNNCLQSTGSAAERVSPPQPSQQKKTPFVGNPHISMTSATPPGPLFLGKGNPPPFPPFNTLAYHSGAPNYPPTQSCYGDQHPAPFKSHVPPPLMNYHSSTPPPAQHSIQPSAPIDDNPHPVHYPDLTPIEQTMKMEELEKLKQEINARERAQTSGNNLKHSQASSKNKAKDTCCIN